jgi:ribonuclease E
VVSLDEASAESHAPADESQAQGEAGEGGRRRRRRGGRGRGERGEGAERAPREASGEATRNQELFDAPTIPSETSAVAMNEVAAEPAREERPRRERPAPRAPLAETSPPAHEEETAPPQAATGLPPAPPAAFHAVIQHDDVEAEAHKPVRKRRRHDGESASNEPAALQMVETQVETPPPVVEDETPRRTKPRRRRGAEAPAEPLMLVETQPGTSAPPTPPAQ